MIFSGMKQITEDDFIGRRVLRLIQNDIAYYAMHTNYDVMGMAELSGEVLGLKKCRSTGCDLPESVRRQSAGSAV